MPKPYDNGKIKIGLLWTPPPQPIDFDMEAIQKALCPPSNRLVKARFEYIVALFKEWASIVLVLLLLAIAVSPYTITTALCSR